jgi:two-component sensor histidine kinase
MSYESGGDVALREKYARELLNMPGEKGYDKRQKKFILEFAGRIFRLSDPMIREDLRESYKLQTISIDEYLKQLDIEEAMIIKEEAMMEGMEKGKFEIARKMLARRMSVSDIVDITGLNERDILSLQ